MSPPVYERQEMWVLRLFLLSVLFISNVCDQDYRGIETINFFFFFLSLVTVHVDCSDRDLAGEVDL